jgi:hypothetical protein
MSKSGVVTRGGHTAQFKEHGGMVTITSVFGSKTTQTGGLPANIVAGNLLGEQILAAKVKS